MTDPDQFEPMNPEVPPPFFVAVVALICIFMGFLFGHSQAALRDDAAIRADLGQPVNR
jgi:hypothetical protein